MTTPTEMRNKLRDANPVPDESRVHLTEEGVEALFCSIVARRDALAGRKTLSVPRKHWSEPMVIPKRAWHQRPALVFAVAAILVIAVMVPVMLVQLRNEAEVADEPAPVTTAVPPTTAAPPTTALQAPATTVPTPSTVPVPRMAPLAWGPAPMSNDLQGGMMSSVTQWGPGYLAGGGVTNTTGRSDPAMWVSDDGLTWERIVSDAFDTGPRPKASDDLYVADVAAGPLGVIAVGGEGRAGSDEYDAAVWVSSDGTAWQRVPPDPAVLGGDGSQAMRQVVAGGPGWVAIADVGEPKYATGIFVSTDGLAWHRVPESEIVPNGEAALITDLAVRDGLIVAVGHTPSANPERTVDGATLYYWLSTTFRQFRPLVWVSDDGYSWRQISLTAPADVPGDAGAVLESITVAADGDFVVIGTAADTLPAVWRSTDGRQWTAVPSSFEGLNVRAAWVPDGEWWVHDLLLPTVTALGDSLIVVGDCAPGGCVFGSTDQGVTWSLIAEYDWMIEEGDDLAVEYFYTGLLPSPQWPRYFADVSTGDGTLLVVGSKAMQWNGVDQWVAAAWLGTES